MRNDTQMNLDPLRPAGTSAQAGLQPSFESGDRALDLDALAVLASRETLVHLSSVSGFGPPSAAATVQVDHRAANAQFLTGAAAWLVSES